MCSMSTLRKVYSNIRAARIAIKDMVRVREIAAVLVRHGFGHFVSTWQLEDRTLIAGLVQNASPDVERLSIYERVSKALQELGPTFVKLGQILSTRSDLIPQIMCDHLKQLQDDVDTISWDTAKSVVESALGGPVGEFFGEFDEEPLASASIAQVHVARLLSGEEVVVKIQRPGVKAAIESDLHILYWLAKKIEEAVPEAEAFDPVSIVGEFEKAISRELKFKLEEKSLERFQRNFVNWDNVYIPKVYGHLCSDTVLVMERLHGTKITDACRVNNDMDEIASQCVAMLFKMVFEDGFFHGDLHPGNLWVLEDGRIGLIDFGLVGRMSQASKDLLAELLFHIVMKDHEGVARVLYSIGTKRGKTDYFAFEADVSDLMFTYFENVSLAEVDFGAYLREVVEGAIRHNLRVPADYTMFFKAIMTVEGIGKIVSPNLDLLAECRPFVERLVAERYSPTRVLRNLADTVQGFARVGQQLPRVASHLIEQIDDGGFRVGFENKQLDEVEKGRSTRNNRLLLTILASVFLLCGTMMRGDGHPTLFGINWKATLCFTLSGVLSFRLMWRVFSSGRW